ncbi:MAG: hypothetical protein ISR47_06675 [Rhodospirillales bacterium]|nr:hypothetical protein [Rhodospirillales bacterium]
MNETLTAEDKNWLTSIGPRLKALYDAIRNHLSEFDTFDKFIRALTLTAAGYVGTATAVAAATVVVLFDNEATELAREIGGDLFAANAAVIFVSMMAILLFQGARFFLNLFCWKWLAWFLWGLSSLSIGVSSAYVYFAVEIGICGGGAYTLPANATQIEARLAPPVRWLVDCTDEFDDWVGRDFGRPARFR